jgi:hypothetical protein
LLLTGALLLWGACAGHPLLAAGTAVILESAPRLGRRLALGRRDFEIIADLCTLALAGMLSYVFAQTRHFPNSLATVLVWLPAFYFGLLLAQRSSSSATVPLSALLWSLRGRRTAQGEPAVALDFGYAALCVLAAAAANVRSLWFFAAAGALALYALWPARRSGAGTGRWIGLAAGALSIALAIQAGLSAFQSRVEEAVLEWLSARWEAERDPYHTRTAIGDVGRLKLSDRIVMRVRTPDRASRVPLLRTASYQHYAAGGWLARNHAFAPLQQRAGIWDIARGSGSMVEIATWFTDGRALLALPSGSYRLEGLEAGRAERNGLAAVRVAEGGDPLRYRAWFDPRVQAEAPPDADDLDVPAMLAPALGRVAEEIGADADAARYIRRIERFFAERFAYSLALSAEDGHGRSLARFLESERHGHCEYFASATVLLLRRAGIPARYAVGYSVQEYSALEAQYVVRRRDAHAWAIAWTGGRWLDVDTTPATWFAEESRDRSMLQPVYDVISWLNFRLAAWRSGDGGDTDSLPLLLLGGPLVILLMWRLYRSRMSRPAPGTAATASGEGSPLQPVLDQLARAGHVRRAGEPLLRWARELPLEDAQAHQQLLEVVRLRYSQRFGDSAPRPEHASRLHQTVARLAERLRVRRARG